MGGWKHKAGTALGRAFSRLAGMAGRGSGNRHRASLRGLWITYELAMLLLAVVSVAMAAAWGYLWHDFAQESMRISSLMEEAQEARSKLYRQVREVTRARLTGDTSALNLYQRYTNQIQGHLQTLRREANDRQELIAVQELDKAYRVIQQDMNKVFVDPYPVTDAVRMKLMDPKRSREMLGSFEGALEGLMGRLRSEREAWREDLNRYTWWAPILIPIPILLAGGLVLVSRRSARRGFVLPMARIMEGTRAMREGDLEVRVPAEGVEEVATLAKTLNEMAGELAASRDALVEKERQAALGELVPVVAHNVRNPLASIRATAQVLEYSETPEERREVQSAIIHSVDRLEHWVNRLVAYLNPFEPRLTETDVGRMADNVVALAASRAGEKGVEIHREGPEEPLVLPMDADLVEQALYGLVENAVDASPAGAAVTVFVQASEGNAEVVVADRGPGLSSYERPSDLTPGPSTKRRGTGLGIPFAYKVLEAHGWSLTFEPREGGGTVARIVMTGSGPGWAPERSHPEEQDGR